MPKLTFAIPYYSGPDYLRHALESVLAQTEPGFEAIVVDDSAGSGTKALVESFGDPRLRYFRNERNLGTAGNWNRCLELAGTELVTLLHADDELMPGYAALMLRAAAAHADAAAFFCETEIIDGQGQPVFSLADYVKQWLRPRGKEIRLNGEPAVASLLRGNYIMCPTLCYRKAKLGPAPFREDRRMVMDLDLTLSLLFRGETLVGLSDKAYCYRRHETNQTALLTDSLVRFHEEISLYESAGRDSAERGWRRAARIGSSKRMLRLNLGYCALRDALKGNMAAAAEKIRLFARPMGADR